MEKINERIYFPLGRNKNKYRVDLLVNSFRQSLLSTETKTLIISFCVSFQVGETSGFIYAEDLTDNLTVFTRS